MKFLTLFFSFFFVFCQQAGAITSMGGMPSISGAFSSPTPSKKPTMVMNPGVTYGKETFDIGIGFSNQTPNTISTLEWKNIHVVGGTVSGESDIKGYPVIYEAFYGMMREGKGKFIDKDYAGNNKTALWSESHGKVVGNAIDASLGTALLKEGGFRALVGALFTQRDYEMRDNTQIISNQPNWNTLTITPRPAAPAAVGTVFKGKNGTYKMKIYGPWVGGDMMFELMEGFGFNASLKGIYGFFKASGVWPSHSFEDRSKAYGVHAKIGLNSELYGVDFFANIGMKYYKVKKGDVKVKNGNLLINYFQGGTFKSYMASVGGKISL
jgi:hypothetical protein